MARQRSRIPGYLFHKASGQAIVVLNGRMSYLGEHGSEESRQEYDRLISEWLANGRTAPNPPPGAVEEEGPSASGGRRATTAERTARRPAR